MLNKLSEQIRVCLEHAEDCACKAAAQPDGSALRQDFLNLEQHWRTLSRSLEFGEQLTDFTNNTKRNPSAPITPIFCGQTFDAETVKAITKAVITTCETLGVSERDDTSIQLIAEKIIELVKSGLKNPTALHLAALQELKSDLH